MTSSARRFADDARGDGFADARDDGFADVQNDGLVDARGDGEAVFRTLAPDGAQAPWEVFADFAPVAGEQVRQSLGAVIGRPELDLRTREIATICMLAALGGNESQLAFHIGAALKVGATPTEIVEALTQVYLYAGFPRALNALQVARQVFAERGIELASAR